MNISFSTSPTQNKILDIVILIPSIVFCSIHLDISYLSYRQTLEQIVLYEQCMNCRFLVKVGEYANDDFTVMCGAVLHLG